VLCTDLHERWVTRSFDDLARAPSEHPVTLCYWGEDEAMARIVARNLEHAVRWALSGAHVLLSVQVAGLGQFGGLLVMRRSSVRFR
jgi:hypothetical protein